MAQPDQTIVSLVQEKGHFVLCTHYNPDGDALGSLLALADILSGMGKKCLCFLEEPVPAIYRFLPGSAQPQTEMEAVRDFIRTACGDVALIALDCGDAKRMGGSKRKRSCRV